jgi:DNA replication and repair protein RecF
MIRFGAEAARVALRGTNGDATFEADVTLAARDARRARLNGERLSSAERLRAVLRTLVFTPDRLAVVKGGPATRRAYLDRSLGRLLPAKASLPIEYAAAIGQRNACLRRIRVGSSSREALRPWTDTVLALGAELVDARAASASLLTKPFARIAGELGLERASLSYEGDPVTAEELEARLGKDLERGVTGAGPHLHDVRIEFGDRELRAYGSQGEQRIAVLALVLAEAEALCAGEGSRPLVLLDDVLSELDGDRRRALGRMVDGMGQTIVTATSADSLPVQPKQSLTVSAGRVT